MEWEQEEFDRLMEKLVEGFKPYFMDHIVFTVLMRVMGKGDEVGLFTDFVYFVYDYREFLPDVEELQSYVAFATFAHYKLRIEGKVKQAGKEVANTYKALLSYVEDLPYDVYPNLHEFALSTYVICKDDKLGLDAYQYKSLFSCAPYLFDKLIFTHHNFLPYHYLTFLSAIREIPQTYWQVFNALLPKIDEDSPETAYKLLHYLGSLILNYKDSFVELCKKYPDKFVIPAIRDLYTSKVDPSEPLDAILENFIKNRIKENYISSIIKQKFKKPKQ